MKQWTLIAYSMAAFMAVGCGKKDSKKSDSPAEVVTTAVSTTQSGSMVTIVYGSNVKDAKFLCTVAANGQPAASDWQTCPTSLPLQPGVSYVLTAKAVSPSGTEDPQPRAITITGDAATAGAPGAAGQLGLSTVILNKSQVTDPYTSSALELTFGIEGNAQVSLDDISYECKRETDTDFHLCHTTTGSAGTDVYDFETLTTGKQYSLEVRATVRSTKAVATSAKVAFTTAITAGGPGNGIPGNGVPGNGVPGNGVPGGPGQNPGQVPGTSTAAGPQTYQVGQYAFTANPGLHMTEYATTANQSAALEFFHVTMDSDPYYLGSFPCDPNINGGRPWPASSPSGQSVFQYCQSAPPSSFYKDYTDGRLAFNHLQIATDVNTVNFVNHDYVTFNYFDSFQMEVMKKTTTFESLCGGAQVFVQPMWISLGFFGVPVTANLYMCNVPLTIPRGNQLPFMGSGNALPGGVAPAAWQNNWWVGTFMLSSDGKNFPLIDCGNPNVQYLSGQPAIHYTPSYCGQVPSANLLEMTFVSQAPNQTPAYFAKYVQSNMMTTLHELQPMARP